MRTYLSPVKLSIFIAAALLFAAPSRSYADRHDGHGDRGEHHFYRYHDHLSFGFHVSLFPEDYYPVWVGGARYYYYDGLYYRWVGPDYVLVEPPIGAVVPQVPSDFVPVVINGITYYINNGIYYVYTRHGYQVVPQPVAAVQAAPAAPVVVPQPAPVTVAAPSAPVSVALDNDNEYTINIPNDKGGYTPVTVKRSGKGFVGPQGEFYEEFPKVKQLRVLYGK